MILVLLLAIYRYCIQTIDLTVHSQIWGQNRAARSAQLARPVFRSGGTDLKNSGPIELGQAGPTKLQDRLKTGQAFPKPARSPLEANSGRSGVGVDGGEEGGVEHDVERGRRWNFLIVNPVYVAHVAE